MFKIRYKIIEDTELEPLELKGADGYFQFQIADETYGIYIPQDTNVFTVSIYWCFFIF